MKKIRSYNLTTSFLLPLLGWRRSVYQPYLVNAYIRHEGVPHFTEGHLFVLLEWNDSDRFNKLEAVITKHESHVSTYEPDEKGEYVMHVFKLRDMVLDDYHKFLNGKYSQISSHSKKLILTSAKTNGTTDKILRRSAELKEYQEDKMGSKLSSEDEVWPCIDDMHTYHKEVFHEGLLVDT